MLTEPGRVIYGVRDLASKITSVGSTLPSEHVASVLVISVCRGPQSFRILTEWTPVRDVKQYARREALISPRDFPDVYLSVTDNFKPSEVMWRGLPYVTSSGPFTGIPRGKPDILYASLTLPTSEVGKCSCRRHRVRSGCGFRPCEFV